MKSIFNNLYIIKVTIIAFSLVAGLSSCEDDSLEKPNPNTTDPVIEETYKINPSVAIKPAKIVVEMREGHSHLAKEENPKPGTGAIFWGPTGVTNDLSGWIKSGGFHANPFDPDNKYPLKREQIMTFELQPDETYKLTEGVDAFRLMTSPIDNGLWKALIIKMFDKEGNRLDLNYKTPEMRDRTQLFFLVKNIAPIPQTQVPGIAVSDTAYLFKNETDYRDDFKEVFDKNNFDVTTPISLIYHEKMPYKDGVASNQVFSYYYCDRATDDTEQSPTLATPVGFRGVFENRACYVSYTVDILVTVLPDGETKGNTFVTADMPTKEQLDHIALMIKIPFRNITEKINSSDITVVEPVKSFFDKAWGSGEFVGSSGITSNIILNKMLHIPVKREFPDFPMQKLIEDYKGVQNASPERSPFWL